MRRHRLNTRAMAALAWSTLIFGAAAPLIGQVVRERPCDAVLNTSVDLPYTWYPQSGPPMDYTFHFSQGFLDEADYAAASSRGEYEFGTILSSGGDGELDNAYIPATCYLRASIYQTDTTWIPQSDYGQPNGDFQFHEIADEYTAGGSEEATDGGVIYCDYDVYYDEDGTELDVAVDCWEEYAE